MNIENSNYGAKNQSEFMENRFTKPLSGLSPSGFGKTEVPDCSKVALRDQDSLPVRDSFELAPQSNVRPEQVISKMAESRISNPRRPLVMTVEAFPRWRPSFNQERSTPDVRDYFYCPNGFPGESKPMTAFFSDMTIDEQYKSEIRERYPFLIDEDTVSPV